MSSGKGHSPYPRDLSRTLSSTIFYQLNAYEPNAVYSLASAMALASASASASAAVAGCGSSRLASLASSPRSPSTRIASFSLASPRLARVASLASPHSPSHRLASVRLARLTLASPCLARLMSSLPLASHRLARPRLASPGSHRLRARLSRSPCLLPRLGHRAVCRRRPRCLRHAAFKNLRDRTRSRVSPSTFFSGRMASPSLNWGRAECFLSPGK